MTQGGKKSHKLVPTPSEGYTGPLFFHFKGLLQVCSSQLNNEHASLFSGTLGVSMQCILKITKYGNVIYFIWVEIWSPKCIHVSVPVWGCPMRIKGKATQEPLLLGCCDGGNFLLMEESERWFSSQTHFPPPVLSSFSSISLIFHSTFSSIKCILYLKRISSARFQLIWFAPSVGKNNRNSSNIFCFHHDSIDEMKGRRATTFFLSPMLRVMGQGFQPLKWLSHTVTLKPSLNAHSATLIFMRNYIPCYIVTPEITAQFLWYNYNTFITYWDARFGTTTKSLF